MMTDETAPGYSVRRKQAIRRARPSAAARGEISADVGVASLDMEQVPRPDFALPPNTIGSSPATTLIQLRGARGFIRSRPAKEGRSPHRPGMNVDFACPGAERPGLWRKTPITAP